MKIPQTFKNLTTGALIALLAASAPSFAEDNTHNDHHDDQNKREKNARAYFETEDRYLWEVDTESTMVFREPVVFEGEVVAETDAHRTVRLADDMLIQVPIMALFWDGHQQVQMQETKVGDQVEIHLRAEEPYPIIKTMEYNTEVGTETTYAIGGMDGVFFVPERFLTRLHANAPDAPARETLSFDED